jgi:hypothetical protein
MLQGLRVISDILFIINLLNCDFRFTRAFNMYPVCGINRSLFAKTTSLLWRIRRSSTFPAWASCLSIESSREQFKQPYFLEINSGSGSEKWSRKTSVWASNVSANSYFEYIQRMYYLISIRHLPLLLSNGFPFFIGRPQLN